MGLFFHKNKTTEYDLTLQRLGFYKKKFHADENPIKGAIFTIVQKILSSVPPKEFNRETKKQGIPVDHIALNFISNASIQFVAGRGTSALLLGEEEVLAAKELLDCASKQKLDLGYIDRKTFDDIHTLFICSLEGVPNMG